MTTTNVDRPFVVPVPGEIVLVRGLSDFKDSLHAIVCPMSFWRENASKRAQQKFDEYSESSPQIPVMEFLEGNGWGLYFTQANNAIPMWSIFDDEEKFKKCSRIYGCCTLRDGSRYYKRFDKWIDIIRSLVTEKKCLSDYAYLGDDISPFIVALLAWQKNNVFYANKDA